MSGLMLSLKTRGGCPPIVQVLGSSLPWLLLQLGLCQFSTRGPFAPEHPDVLEPNCKGDIATSDGKVGLKRIVNKSEMRDKKTTQGLERRGCHDWSSPGKAPRRERRGEERRGEERERRGRGEERRGEEGGRGEERRGEGEERRGEERRGEERRGEERRGRGEERREGEESGEERRRRRGEERVGEERERGRGEESEME
ncbi:hypothetical protein DUI87_06949 [Hirundo rustica rustica]|uniref:Uncharacterized protein n=1 Tax=Hirundo rustica rustica TaxID=333673 RepID=A0A3M0KTP9_HIRRU|nr:hypothetical protein DUI87_06949 [Hirundo rustica rustica]